MEIERQRGISVATSVMGFEYGVSRSTCWTRRAIRTSPKTLRTLTAVDSVILVVDCVKEWRSRPRN